MNILIVEKMKTKSKFYLLIYTLICAITLIFIADADADNHHDVVASPEVIYQLSDYEGVIDTISGEANRAGFTVADIERLVKVAYTNRLYEYIKGNTGGGGGGGDDSNSIDVGDRTTYVMFSPQMLQDTFKTCSPSLSSSDAAFYRRIYAKFRNEKCNEVDAGGGNGNNTPVMKTSLM